MNYKNSDSIFAETKALSIICKTVKELEPYFEKGWVVEHIVPTYHDGGRSVTFFVLEHSDEIE